MYVARGLGAILVADRSIFSNVRRAAAGESTDTRLTGPVVPPAPWLSGVVEAGVGAAVLVLRVVNAVVQAAHRVCETFTMNLFPGAVSKYK